jgi:murein DD-endopeptidase MepM/ murein hydrolase activator NlpD
VPKPILAVFVVFLVGLAVAAPVRGEPARSVDGTWRGVLGGHLHVVVTIKGESGTLESVDQGATLQIETVTVSGDKVRFTVARVGGVWEGTRKGDALDGTWTQNGVPAQPLSFARGEASAPAPPRKPLDAPIDIAVPVAPTPFVGGDGRTHLVYEVHVTNFAPREITLRRFEVLAPDGKLLWQAAGAELPAILDRPGLPPAAGDPTRIGPGLRAVVRVWVTLPAGAKPPATVDDRVTVRVGDDPTEWTVKQRLSVRSEAPIVIGPPLAGARWIAVNGPSNTSGHRGALIPVAGRAFIAQRFAIDWVQLAVSGGGTSLGDTKKNASYACYGAKALAVADGTVVEVKDGIAENVPGISSRAVPITLETIAGNHVVLDLGGGHYALYAHLQPRSLRVKAGERVKRGQVLGLVGNSGNSTEPHLHFHIADAPGGLAAEGLPYAFDFSKRLPLEKEAVDFPQ